MRLENTYTPKYSPAFSAKFLHSESLKLIADYAVEHGKFDKLNQARKNISKAALPTRIRVDVGDNEGKPFVSFTRFRPKDGVIEPKDMNDLKCDKVTIYNEEKHHNPLNFALEKIIKMGNEVPKNKIFKNVVLKKD